MAARLWNPFCCCVVGGVGVANYNNDCSTSRRPLASARPRKISSPRMSSTSLDLSPEELSRTLTLSGSTLQAFTYTELRMATGSFSQANFLGRGGFGPVYKGTIDNEAAAIKCLDLDCDTQGHGEWLAEVLFLGQLKHDNLVKLIGYCYEDEHRMLVYEFMAAGSLERHLFKCITSDSLTWMTRMKIAVGVAKGIAFLHDADMAVIYRDLKASNILLDLDYNTKLSDFGLAKDGPTGDETHVTTRVMGTHGYAAPEYILTGHLTAKSDVYSFGVVLLELLSGRRSVDHARRPREKHLVDWARPYLKHSHSLYRIMDPSLECQFSSKGAEVVAIVAYKCLSQNPQSRPSMKEVVKALEPVLAMEDFFVVSPFMFTVIVGEEKVVNMKVNLKENRLLHHQNHRDRHREKYPNSVIHTRNVLHNHDCFAVGFTGAHRQQQRPVKIPPFRARAVT